MEETASGRQSSGTDMVTTLQTCFVLFGRKSVQDYLGDALNISLCPRVYGGDDLGAAVFGHRHGDHVTVLRRLMNGGWVGVSNRAENLNNRAHSVTGLMTWAGQ